MAFVQGCLGLYLPKSRQRLGLVVSALLMFLVSFSRISELGHSLIPMFLISGFLFFFCNGVKSKGKGLGFGMMAILFLGCSIINQINLLILWLPWFVLIVLGKRFIGYSLFSKGLMVAIPALGIGIVFVQLNCILALGIEPSISMGKAFYFLTVNDPMDLGDRPIISEEEIFSAKASRARVPLEMEYLKLGLKNIKTDPGKWIQNWRANLNRMVFDFPRAHATGKPTVAGTGNRAFATASLFFLSLICFFPWLGARKILPPELLLISVWTAIGILLRSFLSADSEAMLIFTPALCLMIGVTISRILNLRLHPEKQGNLFSADYS